MGTKNNPGAFDCYEAADPDEPMFVLLARDVLASDLVYEWARRYEVIANVGGAPTPKQRAKIDEARACADSMRDWHGIKRQEAAALGDTPRRGEIEMNAVCNDAMTPLFGAGATCEREAGHDGPHRIAARDLSWDQKVYWFGERLGDTPDENTQERVVI